MARLAAALLFLLCADSQAARVVLIPRMSPAAPRLVLGARHQKLIGTGLAGPALAPRVAPATLPVFIEKPGQTPIPPILDGGKQRRALAAKVAEAAGSLARARGEGSAARRLDRLFREEGSAPDSSEAVFASALGARAPIALPGYLIPPAGSERARPVPLPGGRLVRVGRSVIDTRAPDAAEVLDSLRALGEGAIVLGTFDAATARVLNAFAFGRGGVLAHKDALGPLMDPKTTGGWTFILKADGSVVFRESGGVYQPLTPMLQRRILARLGVRPAEESWPRRLARNGLLLLDRIRLILHNGVFP